MIWPDIIMELENQSIGDDGRATLGRALGDYFAGQVQIEGGF